MVTDSNLANLIVVLVGSLTALIAAFVTGYKTVRETDTKAEDTKSEAKRKQIELELKAIDVKTDVSDKIQALYGKMTDDFDEKLTDIREEMANHDTKYKREIAELQDKVNKSALDREYMLKELDLSRKSEKAKSEAGIMLIKAIEQSLELRKVSINDADSCKACTISDQALMKVLNEVKILFQNEIHNA